MTKSKNIISKRTKWTSEMEKVLFERYPNELTENIAKDLGVRTNAVHIHAAKLGIKKSKEFFESSSSGRTSKTNTIGLSARFYKGQTPWNKGMKGLQIGGTATQYKKGHINHNTAPIGAERISKDGYIQIKVKHSQPSHKNWKGKHIIVWEAANGEVPPKHVIAFKDGNKQNCELENLQIYSRQEWMKKNAIHNYPPALKKVMQLKGAIKKRITHIERQSKKELENGIEK